MDINYALNLIENLADGIDPFTGEVLHPDCICNKAEIIRAFHCVLKFCENKKDLPPNTGKPWTRPEEDALLSAYNSGISINKIASEHGRTRTAITSRLRKLGIELN